MVPPSRKSSNQAPQPGSYGNPSGMTVWRFLIYPLNLSGHLYFRCFPFVKLTVQLHIEESASRFSIAIVSLEFCAVFVFWISVGLGNCGSVQIYSAMLLLSAFWRPWHKSAKGRLHSESWGEYIYRYIWKKTVYIPAYIYSPAKEIDCSLPLSLCKEIPVFLSWLMSWPQKQFSLEWSYANTFICWCSKALLGVFRRWWDKVL